MPGSCKQLQLDKIPANVMLVVDRSGSIAKPWDQGQNKWTSVHETLTTAIANNQAGIKFGLKMFPSANATSDYSEAACVTSATLEVPLALANSANISAALPPAFGPAAGGSPTAKGLTAAVKALQGAPASEGRTIVFISDGPFNCMAGAQDNSSLFEILDEDPHSIVADAWTQDGISTIVVGVGVSGDTSGVVKDGNPDNTNAYSHFQTLAVEGGQPRAGEEKFYAAYTEAELAGFMVEAIDKAETCTLALGLTPIDPESTTIKVAGTSYPYMPGLNCATGNGWVYSDGNNTRLALCGTACDALKSVGSAEVDVDCE
ncbi:MAG TPA: vWA domain-containing protein [Nannocystis sp.]|jgi:hypothetical protein